AVSGDGIIFEIINGLLSRKDAKDIKIPIGVIPAGTGNALNICLHGEATGTNVQQSVLTIIKGIPMDIDVCSVSQGNNCYFSFLSQTYGMVADCDIETENMRCLGDTRFAIGLFR
ncbi:13508_t:CDS:2, partial [Acaulospora morrowiae]